MGFFEQDGAGLGGKVETAANHHPGQIVLIRPDNRLFDPVRNAAGRFGIHVEFGGLLQLLCGHGAGAVGRNGGSWRSVYWSAAGGT